MLIGGREREREGEGFANFRSRCVCAEMIYNAVIVHAYADKIDGSEQVCRNVVGKCTHPECIHYAMFANCRNAHDSIKFYAS